jgi:hypothetical protein
LLLESGTLEPNPTPISRSRRRGYRKESGQATEICPVAYFLQLSHTSYLHHCPKMPSYQEFTYRFDPIVASEP